VNVGAMESSGSSVAAPAAPPVLLGATATALLLAVAHAVTDVYQSFLSPLLPRIMDRLDLTVAGAAGLATVLSLSSSLLQPMMGHLSDRHDPRVLLALGPLSGVFLSLIGVAPSVTLLVVLLVLGGVGSAAFHPSGALAAARPEAGPGSGLRLSVFSFGGAVGFAVGPLLAVWLVSRGGPEGLRVAMIPGLLIAGVLLLRLPRPTGRRGGGQGFWPVIRSLRGPLGIIFGISAIAAFAQRLFLTMEPILIAQAGGTEAQGALALSVYLAAQAMGTLVGGVLADRMHRGRLLFILTLLSLPLHALAFALPPGSTMGFVAIVGAGAVNMAVLPPIILVAQGLLPGGAGASSGVVMGLAWAAGSLGIPLAGALANGVGVRSAALMCMPVLLLGCLLTLHPTLRHRSPRRG
jgi:MFS transporter, FSR family, fosmidomycin resistance protein